MADETAIQWTDHTFNAWWGCSRVSPACRFCYADTLAHRWGQELWRRSGPRRMLGKDNWRKPLKWNRDAERAGKPALVFCASMSDVFERHPVDEVNAELDAARARLWDLIAETPWLRWQLLTKRIENVADMVPWGDDWPDTVWIGTSVENQRFAEARIPVLLSLPARVRFLSCEPLLSKLDLTRWIDGAERGGSPGHDHAGNAVGGRVWTDLAPPGNDPRCCSRREGSAVCASTGGHGSVETRGVSACPGIDAGWAGQGACSPNRVDGGESADDPAGAGDQPHQRDQGRQPTRELGADNPVQQRSSRIARTGPLPLDSGREVDARSGDRGSTPAGRKADLQGGDCGALGGHHQNNRADRASEDVGMARRSAIDWLICGGESGAKARPMNLDWARSLRNQCASAEVPFFFKQVGGRTSKAGGSLLDGREHTEVPAYAPMVAVTR